MIFAGPTEETLAYVADIFTVSHFQQLVGRKQLLKGSPVADLFVIAHTRQLNGCVVTEEVLKPNAAKIPNVCAHFDVRCSNLEGMLAIEGWSF